MHPTALCHNPHPLLDASVHTVKRRVGAPPLLLRFLYYPVDEEEKGLFAPHQLFIFFGAISHYRCYRLRYRAGGTKRPLSICEYTLPPSRLHTPPSCLAQFILSIFRVWARNAHQDVDYYTEPTTFYAIITI